MTSAVKVGMYVVMGLSLLGAVAAVTMRNIFHAALAFMLALLGIAAIFIFLRADFLAAAQVLIYVGAVVTLIVFSIMLTQGLPNPKIPAQNSLNLPAITVAILLAGTLIELVRKVPWPTQNGKPEIWVTSADLGRSLMETYALPFEIISVFLIAALIGAVAIAKKDRD